MFEEFLKEASRRYPNCWQQVNDFRRGRGKGLPSWPDWCFMPIAGSYAIVSQHANELAAGFDIARLAALASWRATKGVYRFDPTLYKELADMLVGALPPEVLHSLPEHCCYLELQDAFACGVFVHLESDANDGRLELRLLFDTNGSYDGLMPLAIHLTGSLQDGIEASTAESLKQALLHNVLLPKIDPGSIAKNLSGIVSLVLYLCSVGADCQPVGGRRKSHKAAAEETTIWEIGKVVGAELNEMARNGVKPHVRRAHWHGYWTGPKRAKYELKWLHPILVGAGEEK